MEWVDWTAAGVFLALALGIVNLWYGVIRPIRRERIARLEVRLEHYPYDLSRSGPGSMAWRMVVVNHGPSDAFDVDLPNLPRGQEEAGDIVWQMSGRLPIPRLVPGQQHHIAVWKATGASWPEPLIVSWRDRRGTHTEELWLSPQVVF